MPQVTVIVPLYNARPYIAQAIESVLEQSFDDWEAIVVDDGSTDGSQDVVKSFNDSRIHLVSQANQGPSAARNRAIRDASGEWLAPLDADDIWDSRKLESQLNAAHCQSADLVFGPVDLFGAAHRQRDYETSGYVLEGRSGLSKMISRNHVPHSTVLMRTDLVNHVGQYDTGICGTEDYDLWIRLLLAGAKFAYDPNSLAHYRLSPESVSSNKARMKEMTRVVLQRTTMPGYYLNLQRHCKIVELRFSERRHRRKGGATAQKTRADKAA